MNQISQYRGEYLPDTRLPNTGKLVQAKSLVPRESEKLLKNTLALFVENNNRVYLVTPNYLVPEDAKLVRDSQQNLCGIPAVTGG